MPSRRFRPARSSVAAALLGAGYAAYASGTTAFTAHADVVVGVGFIVSFVGLVYFWPRWTTVRRAVPSRWWPWGALALAVVALEVVSYLSLPRAAHPTLSSLSDRAMQMRAVKAAFVFAWLWLGLRIVRPA